MRRAPLLSLPALLAALVLGTGGGCGLSVERLFPDRVADGVARLMVRNAATLTGQVSDDERCGFASPEVLESYVVDGEVGGRGTVTYTVTGCELDFGDVPAVTDTNCNDVDTLTRGKVVVDAVRVVEGRLTGDPGTPVIPESSEAASMQFTARFEDYEVRRTDSDKALTILDGEMRYRVRPHLAQSESLGVCSVAGSNLTLENVELVDAAVMVDGGDRVFEAEVPQSHLNAQLGKWQNKEDWLSGTVTAWDTEVEVPIEGEHPGLDPDYDSDVFLSSYECTEDLAQPIDYTCPDLTPKFAQGTAQLSIATFANVMRLLEADTTCGFSSPQVLDNPELLGVEGEAGGQARYVIEEPCPLNIPEDTIVAVDCHDKINFADGRVWVTGTKVVSGIRSGDPAQPIVPTSDQPAIISLEYEVESLRTFDSTGANMLTLHSGTMSGTARPVTAIDELTGACSIPTPITTFENVTLENAQGLLTSDGKSFGIEVASASLDAQNGPRGDKENWLSGSITLDGQEIAIPVGDEPVLDPSYEAEAFFSSFACAENMVLPEEPSDCDFTQVLGEGSARLIIALAGAVASKVNSDDECGFENYSVLLAPYQTEGEPGEMGMMSWRIQDCTVGSEGITQHEETCTGGRTMTGGFAHVDATRVVTGERTDMVFGLVNAIVPRDREAVTVELTEVDLEELTIEPWGAGASEPKGRLTIHYGRLSAVVQPILGERESEPGTFDVPTPVAVLSDVRLEDADATLESEGKTFHLRLDDVVLHATNGTWGGASNTIGGSLNVNGAEVQIEDPILDDAFEQAAFDASYQCREDLLEVIPAE